MRGFRLHLLVEFCPGPHRLIGVGLCSALGLIDGDAARRSSKRCPDIGDDCGQLVPRGASIPTTGVQSLPELLFPRMFTTNCFRVLHEAGEHAVDQLKLLCFETVGSTIIEERFRGIFGQQLHGSRIKLVS